MQWILVNIFFYSKDREWSDKTLRYILSSTELVFCPYNNLFFGFSINSISSYLVCSFNLFSHSGHGIGQPSKISISLWEGTIKIFFMSVVPMSR